jgi:hypothetical protein
MKAAIGQLWSQKNHWRYCFMRRRPVLKHATVLELLRVEQYTYVRSVYTKNNIRMLEVSTQK